ncbi:MAG TPA: TIGR01777 family oxidoreductase [Solirubrobacteraceae bacterium]
MRVLVSGSHGLIGSALVRTLRTRGHEVGRIVRQDPRARAGSGDVSWDIEASTIDTPAMEGADAVVHLAGPSLARRWSSSYQARLRDSRVDGTTLLATALAQLDRPPAVMVSGSAIGYYGDRGEEVLTEDSEAGSGFLAELVRAWEAATAPAEKVGVRVVHLRSGIVQSAEGGALGKQLPLFRLGLGGQLGPGRQYLSWISLGDEVEAIMHALTHDAVRGPVNATAPNPVTNAEYTRVLGAAVGRPTLLHVPTFALSIALGADMARETVLVSQRVRPVRLEATGYSFLHPELPAALAAALGR